MMRCSGCHEISYCDGDCQKAHRAEHREYCKERAAAHAALNAAPAKLVSSGDDYDTETLRRDADAGDAGAMMQLGLCHHFGKGGLGVDPAEAVRWYKRSVEGVNPPAGAFFNLAEAYYFGLATPKNLPEAVRLYRIAADMGVVYAQYNLGMCFEHGEGVPYNPVEAFTWYKRAADAGHPEAQCNVGAALLHGLGVPEDKVAGIGYIRRAAEGGDATSMYNLGACFKNGDGVPRDFPQAVAWWKRARDAGYSAAAAALAQFAVGMPPELRAAIGL